MSGGTCSGRGLAGIARAVPIAPSKRGAPTLLLLVRAVMMVLLCQAESGEKAEALPKESRAAGCGRCFNSEAAGASRQPQACPESDV